MEQEVELFDKNGVSVAAVVDDNIILSNFEQYGHKLTITLQRKNDPLVVKTIDDGLSIVEGKGITTDYSINEFNLCNAILERLFLSGITVAESQKDDDPHSYGQKITLPKKTAEYIVKTSGDTDYVLTKDGTIYNIHMNKQAVIFRLKTYSDKLSPGDAKETNEALIEMIECLPEKELAQLIENDLHFIDRANAKHKISPADDKFGNAVPVYSCSRSKVAGLLKHLSNRMKKVYNTKHKIYLLIEDAYPGNAKECEESVMYDDGEISFEILDIKDDWHVTVRSGFEDGTKFHMTNYHISPSSIELIINMLKNSN